MSSCELALERRAAATRNAVPRSKPSVAIATFHPSLTSPSTFDLVGARVVEEHLVELGGARSSAGAAAPRRRAGPSGSGGTRGPCAPVDVGVGAGDAEAPVGAVRERRPHLLPVDRPTRRRRARPGSGRWRGRSRRWAPSTPGTTAPRPTGSSGGSAASARRCRTAISVGAKRPSPKKLIRAGALGLRVLLVEDHLLDECRRRARRTPRATTCRPSGPCRAAAPTRPGRPSRSRRPGRRRRRCAANSPTRCSASQARTSSRNAASAGVSRKSIGPGRPYLTDRSSFHTPPPLPKVSFGRS